MKNEYCVYMHTLPNGKCYIGQTKQKPEYRFRNGDGYKGCRYFYSAIQKYGWEKIKHEILIDDLTQKEADYYEKYYITLYRSNNKEYGYNLRSGGTAGYEYTDEVKRLIAEKQTGRKQSAETRLKHSEALKRYYATYEVSEETRQKLRRANKGQFKKGVSHECSPETRKKISEALRDRKGKPLTEKERKHLSEVMKARETTIQMLENIMPHQFQKGHPPNEKSMNTLRQKYSKKVVQYDLNGNEIAIHSSITEASKAIGMSTNAVGNAVRGYTKTAGGYVWGYADGN